MGVFSKINKFKKNENNLNHGMIKFYSLKKNDDL